jgi:hypothetical protein
MRRILFNVGRGITTDEELPSGTMGQIGWRRLLEQLRAAGEFKQNERVTHVEVTPLGIRYRVEP